MNNNNNNTTYGNITVENSKDTNFGTIDNSRRKTVVKISLGKIVIVAFVLVGIVAAALFIFPGSGETIPPGTYAPAEGGIASMYSFTFKGNKATMSVAGIGTEVSYEIEDGQLKFISQLGGPAVTFSYEKKGSSIYLNGIEYVKQ
jgi:hypothetical protein